MKHVGADLNVDSLFRMGILTFNKKCLKKLKNFTLLHWIKQYQYLSSVPDQWHFGTDPDPLIRTFDERIKIRILLLSSVTFKTNFFCCSSFNAYSFLKVPVYSYHSSEIKNQKDVTKQKKIKVFLLFCFLMEGSGSGAGSGQKIKDLDQGGPTTYTDPKSGSRSKTINLSRLKVRSKCR